MPGTGVEHAIKHGQVLFVPSEFRMRALAKLQLILGQLRQKFLLGHRRYLHIAVQVFCDYN